MQIKTEGDGCHGYNDFMVVMVTMTSFKAIHGIAPSYISDLILVKPNSSYNSRSSSAGILLAFPSWKTKRTLGDR